MIASKSVANHCDSQQGVNEVIALVTQCALSTSQLVSCTKVCASTIGSRECQEQILEAARQVERQVELVMGVAQTHCQSVAALSELQGCAHNVSNAVAQLLDNVRASNEQIVNMQEESHCQAPGDEFQDESIEKIFQATANLLASMGDPAEMIRQAKCLAQATTDLINSLKRDANQQSSGGEQQKRLLIAAKLLAEATAKIVEAAKGCATSPEDERCQNGLRRAVDELKSAARSAVSGGDAMQLRLIKRLELSAKQAASCATQTIAAVQVCIMQQANYNEDSSMTKLLAFFFFFFVTSLDFKSYRLI